ncbi:hypothetical protein, partial [Agrobacterium sp. CG674]
MGSRVFSGNEDFNGRSILPSGLSDRLKQVAVLALCGGEELTTKYSIGYVYAILAMNRSHFPVALGMGAINILMMLGYLLVFNAV